MAPTRDRVVVRYLLRPVPFERKQQRQRQQRQRRQHHRQEEEEADDEEGEDMSWQSKREQRQW